MRKACVYILFVPNAIGNSHLSYPCMGTALEGGEGGDLDSEGEGGTSKTHRRGEAPNVVLYSRVGAFDFIYYDTQLKIALC